eukprot:TRINITY_DN4836_c0_g1_i1.p1 TRINITY_DN4836_c0_g1~~TRINITY_DN4836_c0_g1_i1.p1  ORF type:complete len:868 (-),score=367.58 TRINITY_DN4836_c0_g1_i1:35-2332(-)
MGIPKDRIIPLGKEDNFWTMGEGKGPCGPCTEIFYLQDHPDSDGDRWLEIWNLVFMEYSKNEREELTKLGRTCIDTGMGLERVTSVLQGKSNNFNIDLFEEIIAKCRIVLSLKRGNQSCPVNEMEELIGLRVISDHLRAASFLIADGVLPSNVGRGYILRRIIRRALRFSNKLGVSQPFLSDLYPALVEQMGDAYPELKSRGSVICEVLEAEETVFLKTLTQGLKILNQNFVSGSLKHEEGKEKELSPSLVFQLFDTYGFPTDLTTNIAGENGWTINEIAVKGLIEESKKASKATWKGSSNSGFPDELKSWKDSIGNSNFVGYDQSLHSKSHKGIEVKIVGIHRSNEATELSSDLPESPPSETQQLWISIDPCPFYGTSGGQLGDSGHLVFQNGVELAVKSAVKPYEGGIALQVVDTIEKIEGLFILGQLKENNQVKAFVNHLDRHHAAKNHTATHLLHSALRNVLGSYVRQAGSYVGPDRLRFDYTCKVAPTKEQLEIIQDQVMNSIEEDLPVGSEEMGRDEAMNSGAMSLFGEKYGERVRVIQVPGVSVELCGGTHVQRTSQIGAFKIISDKSVAAGIRRIEALTGRSALEWYTGQIKRIEHLADRLGVKPFQLEPVIEKIVSQKKCLEKDLENLQRKMSVQTKENSNRKKERVEGVMDNEFKTKVNMLIDLEEEESIDMMREQAINSANQEKDHNTFHVVISGSRVAIATHSTGLHAGKTIESLFKLIGDGRGGGSQSVSQGKLSSNFSIQLKVTKSFFGIQ